MPSSYLIPEQLTPNNCNKLPPCQFTQSFSTLSWSSLTQLSSSVPCQLQCWLGVRKNTKSPRDWISACTERIIHQWNGHEKQLQTYMLHPWSTSSTRNILRSMLLSHVSRGKRWEMVSGSALAHPCWRTPQKREILQGKNSFLQSLLHQKPLVSQKTSKGEGQSRLRPGPGSEMHTSSMEPSVFQL